MLDSQNLVELEQHRRGRERAERELLLWHRLGKWLIIAAALMIVASHAWAAFG